MFLLLLRISFIVCLLVMFVVVVVVVVRLQSLVKVRERARESCEFLGIQSNNFASGAHPIRIVVVVVHCCCCCFVVARQAMFYL